MDLIIIVELPITRTLWDPFKLRLVRPYRTINNYASLFVVTIPYTYPAYFIRWIPLSQNLSYNLVKYN